MRLTIHVSVDDEETDVPLLLYEHSELLRVGSPELPEAMQGVAAAVQAGIAEARGSISEQIAENTEGLSG